MAIDLRVLTSDAGITQNISQTHLFISSWETETEEESIREIFHLNALGTDAEIRAAVLAWNILATMVWEFWNEPMRFIFCYLYVKSDTEAQKRSVIRSLSITPRPYQKFTPTLGKQAMFYDLIIERDPYWEGSINTYSQSNLDVNGGHFLPSVTVGTRPSRIMSVNLTPNSGNVENFVTAWMGIQPKYRQANLTGMNFLIDARSGTPWNTAVDTGTVIRVADPSETELTQYLSVNLSQHDAVDYNKYRGKFLLLGKFNFSGTGTMAIRMSYGCLNLLLVKKTPNPIVYIDGVNAGVQIGKNSWIELGEVIFPTHSGLLADDLADDGFTIEAMDITGGLTNFDIDLFVLIPASHMCKISELVIDYDPTNPLSVQIWSQPTGVEEALNYRSSDIKKQVILETTNWYWPMDGGAFVLAALSADGSVKFDEGFDVTLTIIDRVDDFET